MSPSPTTLPSASSATAPEQHTMRPPGGATVTCTYGPTGAGAPSGLIDSFVMALGGLARQRPGGTVAGAELGRALEELLAERVDLERGRAARTFVARGQLRAQAGGLVLVDAVLERVRVDDLDRHAVDVARLLE